jgi:predicted outer membrane repeat protein
MQRPNPFVRGIRLLLLATTGLLWASNALAIDLLVYNNNDSGPGSLRQAIMDNNASAGGNTIVFSNSVTGTITLTSGELLITRHGTIRGPGAGILAVNGNAAGRVFRINVTNDAAVLISGLTITNGVVPLVFPASGGGIWNDHSLLVVDNCTISGNMAPTHGGGIWNDGSSSGRASMMVRDSTFSGNSVSTSGGAIYSDGSSGGAAAVSVSTSTFSGNTAVNAGGGIYNDASEGSASVSVNASTFSSNSVASTSVGTGGGGIYNHGLSGSATLFVHASTFSGNSANSGGGIYNNAPFGSATLEIGNTILKAGASGVTILNNFGTVTSRGYNLSSDNGGGVLTNALDQLNTDPLLGPLANNGGPTFTHALLPGSPAIDQGKRDAIPHLSRTDDQRGAPRPFDFAAIPNAPGGDGSDIGAFETGRPKLNIQQFGNDVVLSWPSYYGDFTLQSSTNVTASNSWIVAGGSAAVVGNDYRQTNGPISANKFFRLDGN